MNNNQLRVNPAMPNVLADAASVFHNEPFVIGQLNSLKSNTIPLFPSDTEVKKAIQKGDSDVFELTNDRDLVVRYYTGTVVSKVKGKQTTSSHFHSNSEETVFRAIIDIVRLGHGQLVQRSESVFSVRFPLQKLRNYLEEIGRTKSGKSLNKSMQLLENCMVEVIQTSNGKTRSYKSNILSHVKKVDNAHDEGWYQADLHELVVRDILHGDYRLIDHCFVQHKGKAGRLMISLLDKLRHEYTQAPQQYTPSIEPFTFTWRDLCFTSGYKPNIESPNIRRSINELKQLLFQNQVIEDINDFTRAKAIDPETGLTDYVCKIKPSRRWGHSQMVSNGRVKAIKQNLQQINA